MKSNERVKRQIVDESFAIVGGPANVLINHCFSVDYDLDTSIRIVTGVGFHIHVHLVPFAFFDAACCWIGFAKVASTGSGHALIVDVGMEVDSFGRGIVVPHQSKRTTSAIMGQIASGISVSNTKAEAYLATTAPLELTVKSHLEVEFIRSSIRNFRVGNQTTCSRQSIFLHRDA